MKDLLLWASTVLLMGAATAVGLLVPVALGADSVLVITLSMAACLVPAGLFAARRANRQTHWGDQVGWKVALLVILGLAAGIAGMVYLESIDSDAARVALRAIKTLGQVGQFIVFGLLGVAGVVYLRSILRTRRETRRQLPET